MEQSLRILILEDNELDVQLMQRELQKARLSFLAVRVQTLEEFIQQLEVFLPDLILADYTLPTTNGEEALTVAKQHNPDIPFIFVTGTIGEETAIEMLKMGATDYVMKENLKRLGAAVTHALNEANERKAHERTEQAYKDTMNRYREIVETASDIIFTMDYKGYFTQVNQAGLKSCGYSIGEMWKKKYLDLILPQHRERVKRHYMRQFLSKQPVTYMEYPIHSKSGDIIWYGQNAVPVFDGEFVVGFHVICRDITERRQQYEQLELKLSILDQVQIPIIAIDEEGNITFWNKSAEVLFLWQRPEVLGKSIFEDILSRVGREKIMAMLREEGEQTLAATRKDGNPISLRIENSKLADSYGVPLGYVWTCRSSAEEHG